MPDISEHTPDRLVHLFFVDQALPTPTFQQLHDRVVQAIASGQLTGGQKLPTVRGLAEALQLAPNTVAKAYKSLETAKIIEGKGRSGTFVRFAADPVEAAAQHLARDTARAFTALGVDAARAQEFIAAAYTAHDSSGASG